MPPFEPSALLTAWTPAPFGMLLVAVVGGWYAWNVAGARRGGLRWPWWRVGLYACFGVGTLAYAVIGPLQVYRAHLFWIGALQVGVLASLTPVGLALGDPIGLLRQQPGTRRHWIVRVLEGPAAQVLMFPALSSLLAVGTILAVFFTPLFAASIRSARVADLLDVALVLTGLLFVLPLMVEELLPAWATPAIRTGLAFLDGLLDAIPGILVMTASTLLAPGFPGFVGRVGAPSPLLDQQLGGGALLAVAESIGLPVIGVVMLQWMRSDAVQAQEIDARLDAELAARPVAPPGSPVDPSGDSLVVLPVAATETSPETTGSGLWWENDPRLSGRIRHTPD